MKAMPFLLLFLAASAFAEVREIKSMGEILPGIRKGTLVIFDLDNTLIQPAQSLGSDQWVSLLTKRFVAAGTPENEATSRAVGMFARVQHLTRVVPVEQINPQVVRKLQDQGVTVLGLTARPLDLMERTRTELASVGIDLNRQPLLNIAHQTFSGGTAAYDQGIVYVGPFNNKGRMLSTVLDAHSIEPSHVVFVDDKAHHTAAVDQSMSARSIPVIAYRYGAADATVAALDGALVDFEWTHFLSTGVLLSDDEARRLLPQ